MVVGREMLGAASCYSLCSQGRASLQVGKVHISMKKCSCGSERLAIADPSPTYTFQPLFLLARELKASGFSGREE